MTDKQKLINDIYKHWDFVYQIIYNRVKHIELARDIRSDILVQISNRKTINYDGTFKPFMSAVVRNFCIDYFRTKGERIMYNCNSVFDSVYVSEVIDHSDLHFEMNVDEDLVKKCKRHVYNKYQKKWRKIFYYTLQGYKHREIAVIMDIPEGTVKTAIHHMSNDFKKNKHKYL